MAEYAYTDKLRTKTITPEEALLERSQGVFRDYYCPNPNCDAILAPVKGDENKHPNPFFRARKTKKHVEGCDYKAYYDEEAANEAARTRNAGLFESDFSIEALLSRILSYVPPESTSDSQRGVSRSIEEDEKVIREKIISSTAKLYKYCKFRSISETLGERQIKEFVIDDETICDTYRYFIKEGTYMLNVPVLGMYYIPDKKIIGLKYTKDFLCGLSVDYRFTLHFTSEEFFRDETSLLMKFRQTRSNLVFVSTVTKNFGDDKNYHCTIENPAQLYFVQSDELVPNDQEK